MKQNKLKMYSNILASHDDKNSLMFCYSYKYKGSLRFDKCISVIYKSRTIHLSLLPQYVPNRILRYIFV